MPRAAMRPRGCCSIGSGKRDEAKAAYAKAVELGSTSAFAHYRLASLTWQPSPSRETLAEIEKHLAKAVSLNNRYAAAYAWLGETRAALGTGDPMGLIRRAISHRAEGGAPSPPRRPCARPSGQARRRAPRRPGRAGARRDRRRSPRGAGVAGHDCEGQAGRRRAVIVIPMFHVGDAPVAPRIYGGPRRPRWISTRLRKRSGESSGSTWKCRA